MESDPQNPKSPDAVDAPEEGVTPSRGDDEQSGAPGGVKASAAGSEDDAANAGSDDSDDSESEGSDGASESGGSDDESDDSGSDADDSDDDESDDDDSDDDSDESDDSDDSDDDAAGDDLNADSGDDDSGDDSDDDDSDDDDSDDDDSDDDSDDDESDAERASRENEGAAPLPEYVERRKHHVAPALIAIERIDTDDTYKLRPEGEVDKLATDIARVGQLFPIDVRLKPPDRFQVITGFRRVRALRFLQREKVLARLHTDLSDEDALLLALASAIHQEPLPREQVSHVKDRLERESRLTPILRDMLDKAINPDEQLEPENEQEIDADELATTTAAKLGELNQDLALLADVFASLDDERKLELLKQLRYSAELVAYLEGITS